MILLLGGTTETPEIANLLAENNFQVLISNLTGSTSTNWNLPPAVRLRHGQLDLNTMSQLIADENITAILDAAHPYAQQLHTTAIQAAAKTNLPYYRYERPGTNYDGYDVNFAPDHRSAAQITFELGKTALLTIGSKNLEPYVKIAHEKNATLFARVLPCPESLTHCTQCGIESDFIIAKQGPFTTQQNCDLIKTHSIDVLVTKDSGAPGGVPQKLKAAKKCGIKVVVIKKPPTKYKPTQKFNSIKKLITKITTDKNTTPTDISY